jgi:hypothetical protein
MKLLTLLCGLVLLALSGCTSYKAGIAEVRDIGQYGNATLVNEVQVAAEVYSTADKIKQGFYIDVSEKDYYPVQIVVQNGAANRMLVLKERIEVSDSAGNSYRPINVATMADEFEHNKMAYALLGFGIFSYMSADDANKKMAADWRDKELVSESIVNPGRKTAGFIYLKMPKGVKPVGMTLNLDVENLETKAVSKFAVRL